MTNKDKIYANTDKDGLRVNSDKTSGHSGQPPNKNHTMPDEIWANWTPVDVGCGEWDKVFLGDDVPYIRGDIHEQAR